MAQIEEIIKAVDNKLLEMGKDYLMLQQASKLLLALGIIENSKELKQLLENGEIPHAYKTDTSPKQWILPLSEGRKNRKDKLNNKKYNLTTINIMKQVKLVYAILASLIFTACSETDNKYVEYIPFQESENGLWGMIAPNGEILFSEEFEEKPTVVHNGRFFIQTNNRTWEMYTAEEKPQPIGKEYAHISGFQNGVAIVSEKGKPVSIIDTEGNTIRVLDSIAEKKVLGVRPFKNNYAVFMTTDSLMGAVNRNGICIIKPEYYILSECNDNKFIGILSKYKNKNEFIISVINTTGETKLELPQDKCNHIGRAYFSHGMLAVCVTIENQEMWGIINDMGEYVVKPSSKFKEIGSISERSFTYSNGTGWGLIGIDGKTMIRPKYKGLYHDQENLLLAKVKKDSIYEYMYIDDKDNPIEKEKYKWVFPFSQLDGVHSIVNIDDYFSIINKKGEKIERLPNITNIGFSEGEDFIESDFLDLNNFISELNISPDGFMGLTFKSTPQEAVKLSVEFGNFIGYSKDEPVDDPMWYNNNDYVKIKRTIGNIETLSYINFTGNLSKKIYHTKRELNYDYWNGYYYYSDNKIPAGYKWSDVSLSSFTLYIYNRGIMHGKLNSLFSALSDKFKTFGTVIEEQEDFIKLKLNNTYSAIIVVSEDNLGVSWGNL